MQHLGTFGTCQSELHHQLASVTDTKGEGVLAGIELVEGLFCLGIIEEGACPSFGGAEYVGIGETTTEDNHIDVLQSLTTTDQVCHHHVLHVEAGKIQTVCHLTLTIGSLLTDDSCLRSTLRTLSSPRLQTILGKGTSEVLVELHLNRLLLVVLITLLRLTVETLFAVKQIGGLIPCVTKGVDIKGVLFVTSLHDDGTAVLYRITDLGIADTQVLHELLELELVLVADLDDDTRVLCEEGLDDVSVSTEVVQVDMHTSLGVGKAHL